MFTLTPTGSDAMQDCIRATFAGYTPFADFIAGCLVFDSAHESSAGASSVATHVFGFTFGGTSASNMDWKVAVYPWPLPTGPLPTPQFFSVGRTTFTPTTPFVVIAEASDEWHKMEDHLFDHGREWVEEICPGKLSAHIGPTITGKRKRVKAVPVNMDAHATVHTKKPTTEKKRKTAAATKITKTSRPAGQKDKPLPKKTTKTEKWGSSKDKAERMLKRRLSEQKKANTAPPQPFLVDEAKMQDMMNKAAAQAASSAPEGFASQLQDMYQKIALAELEAKLAEAESKARKHKNENL